MPYRFRLRLRFRSRVQLLALCLFFCLALFAFGGLLWGRARAAAPPAQTPLASAIFPRQFYLTTNYHNGAAARYACTPGYHMASLWELLDTAGLRYNTSLGEMNADSGQGPPAGTGGWVRTGAASGSTGVPGESNCWAWSSGSSGVSGSTAYLSADWTSGGEDVGVWSVGGAACSGTLRVWCVADRAGFTLFLPLILQD